MTSASHKDDREERHLMRMRGAGPRVAAPAFDFAFASIARPPDQVLEAHERASNQSQAAQHGKQCRNDTIQASHSSDVARKASAKRAKLEKTQVSSATYQSSLHDTNATGLDNKATKSSQTLSRGTKRHLSSSMTCGSPSRSPGDDQSSKKSLQVLGKSRDISKKSSKRFSTDLIDPVASACDEAKNILDQHGRMCRVVPDKKDYLEVSTQYHNSVQANTSDVNICDALGAAAASKQQSSVSTNPKLASQTRSAASKRTKTKPATRAILRLGDANRRTLSDQIDVDRKPVKNRVHGGSQLRQTTIDDQDPSDPLCSAIVTPPEPIRTTKSIDLMTKGTNVVGKIAQSQNSAVMKTASISEENIQPRSSKQAIAQRKPGIRSRRVYRDVPSDDNMDLDDLITNIATLTKRKTPV